MGTYKRAASDGASVGTVDWARQKPKQISEHHHPHSPAHRSVVVIEQAKQRALSGMEFKPQITRPDLIDNWTEADQAELQCLIERWQPGAGRDGLNLLIDDHQLSDGTHRAVLARSRARPC